MCYQEFREHIITFILCSIYALELVLNVVWASFSQHEHYNMIGAVFLAHYVIICLLIIPKLYLVISRTYFELFCLSLAGLVEFIAFFIVPVVLSNPEGWYKISIVGAYSFFLIFAYVIIIFKTNQNAKIF